MVPDNVPRMLFEKTNYTLKILAYLKNKPVIFLLGKYHQKNRSKLISLFGSKIFSLGVDDLFIKSNIIQNNLSKTAIFTSRSDRNLNILIDIWINYIYPKSNEFKLLLRTISRAIF